MFHQTAPLWGQTLIDVEGNTWRAGLSPTRITPFARLRVQFVEWHNGWRPHMFLDGARPDDVFRRDLPDPVPRVASTL